MTTWMFIDLDQCCNMACHIQPADDQRVYCFARKNYTGPTPLCGEMVYALSDSSQAADSMFYFTLGTLLPSMSTMDTCFIMSSDKDWLHALDILRSAGVNYVHNVKEIGNLREYGIRVMSPERVALHAVNKMRSGRN